MSLMYINHQCCYQMVSLRTPDYTEQKMHSARTMAGLNEIQDMERPPAWGVVSKHVTVQLLDIVLANRFGMPFYFKSTFSLIAITPLESLKICMNPKPRAIIAVQLGYYSFSVRRHGQVSFS